MFSGRLPWSAPENALTTLLAARRAAGAPLHDLTESNPTRVGIDYPRDLLDVLADPAGLVHAPDPLGLSAARAAVAAEVGARPEDVVLCASTSEAYAWLFKLLCDPGDAVLAPPPRYPLFEHLAALEGVRLVDEPDARTRATLVVSPGNPSGRYLRRDELAALDAAGRPIVCDEVFAGYPFAPPPADAVTSLAAEPTASLTFSLGGLSKSCGLPQLKLGWIVLGGPAELRAAARARLELIADTYLSLATPVQLAAARLLAAGAGIRRQILDRIRRHRAALAAAVAGTALTLAPADAGWSAVVRVPATRTDEAWALALLRDHDTLVHPGYYFDLTGGTFLALSLLPAPDVFEAGLRALAKIG